MMVLNTNLAAKFSTTQYTNFDFNSLVKFNGSFLCANGSGLYTHSGTNDDGDEIEAYFVTSSMDFGINNDKRLRYVYLSLEATDDLSLIVNTEKVAAITYPITITTTGQQDIRIPISRALHGRFWTFKIGNGTSGADFSIDEIKVLPLLRNTKH